MLLAGRFKVGDEIVGKCAERVAARRIGLQIAISEFVKQIVADGVATGWEEVAQAMK